MLSTGKLGIDSLLLLKAFKETFKEPSSSKDNIVGFPKAELRKQSILLEKLGH